ASLFEEHGFGDIKISVKHHDPVVMVAAYRELAAKCDYPLHLGVTEAGPAFQGTVKSAVAFGALLAEGIGDTIRVSLSAPPVAEIKVGGAPRQCVRVCAAGRGDQGRQRDPGVVGAQGAWPRDRVLPVVRPGPGRRL